MTRENYLPGPFEWVCFLCDFIAPAGLREAGGSRPGLGAEVTGGKHGAGDPGRVVTVVLKDSYRRRVYVEPLGRAVQVEPMEPTLKAPKGLK